MNEALKQVLLMEAWATWIDSIGQDDNPDPATLLEYLRELGVHPETLAQMRREAEEYGHEFPDP